jgi:putative ABC transport system ATP-binding protein
LSAIVAIEGLRFRWRSDGPEILDLPSLQVGPGEHVFVEGPSGAGKSTLLGILAGVTAVDTGRVEVLGTRLDQLRAAQRDRFRADHIGFVFQLFNLLPYLGIIDNVTLPARFSRRRRERALQRASSLDAEAKRLLDHLDLGQPALLQQPVRELSIGQQQRVAAARALFGAPELLIADEPTSALDSDRRRVFLELLFTECEAAGTTLIFVSHDPSLETLFDRTLRLPELNAAARNHAEPPMPVDETPPARAETGAPHAETQASSGQPPAAMTQDR